MSHDLEGPGLTRGMTRLAAAAALSAVLLYVGGCAGGSAAADAPSQGYMESYRKGEYAQAYREAAREALSGSSSNSEQAALIAGQAAHAMGNYSDAARWLRPLRESTNKQIAGQASATLGLIAQQNGDQQQAADLLSEAGDKLTLDAAAKSQLFAGDSLYYLGKRDDARAMWEKAKGNAKYDAALAASIESRLAGGSVPHLTVKPTSGSFRPMANGTNATPKGQGPFTLQAGAFSTLERAVKAAKSITPRATKAGYEAPRVVNAIDSKGRRIYAVRFGRFPTKAAAESARNSFGSDVIATVASGE